MVNTSRPTAIQLDKPGRKLLIPWSDGHRSEFEWGMLREHCPCAQCRGGHDVDPAPPDKDVFMLTPVKGYEITSVEVVGNYALRIVWSDAHDSGIYTWDYLRGLCTCAECRATTAAAE